MSTHDFILTPGVWLGEGKITFSTSPEFLKFYTKWYIVKENDGLEARQQVQMLDVENQVINTLFFEDITPTTFSVTLKNNLMEPVKGKGLIYQETIAWEFRGNPSFEGFEVYERQENGDYSFHAEYSSSEQHRTVVEGLIWKKSTE